MNKIKRRFRQLKSFVIYIFVYIFTKFYNKKSSIWLIAERGIDARDNGYVFYRYLKENHPEIKMKFVISNDSPDINRIDLIDRVKYKSIKHYWYYITAKVLISTHYQGYSPNLELYSQLDKRNIIKVRGKKVLLDHCVRMGKRGCTKETVKIDLMICGIEKEYNALKENAGYDEGVLQNIGFARFDNLYRNKHCKTKQQILFMPTWRVKYTNFTQEKFRKSEYFEACNKLINNKRLHSFLKKNNMKFIFYPHIEMQKFIHLFNTDCENVEIRYADNAVVEDLLIQSKILITDYSSVFFDFAALEKPVVYFHFDNDENIRAQEVRWFEFEKDGFGTVCTEVDELVDTLENTNFERPDIFYLERIKNTFNIVDDKNSERNYNAIKKMLRQKEEEKDEE